MAGANQNQPKKKAPKTITVTRPQLATGVAVPTGRPVKIVVAKRPLSFSA
jgi:hypothetical protein